MTVHASANTSAHAAVNVVARTFSSIRRAFSWLGAALTRYQEARIEAEVRRLRHRLGRTDDDDRAIGT
jgi:hypothetical protein